MLHFENVIIAYDSKPLLRDVRFHLEPGTAGVLVGPSGCGKSSLLLATAGLVSFQGEIRVQDLTVDAHNVQQIRRECLAWLPQEIGLPASSVSDLFRSLRELRANRGARGLDESKVLEYFEMLGLSEDLLTRAMTEISGGQKVRILLGALLALKRPLLFLDEPSAMLDDVSTERVWEAIHHSGVTVLSTSNDPRWIAKHRVQIPVQEFAA